MSLSNGNKNSIRNSVMSKSQPQNQTDMNQRNQPIKQPHHLPQQDHKHNQQKESGKQSQNEK